MTPVAEIDCVTPSLEGILVMIAHSINRDTHRINSCTGDIGSLDQVLLGRVENTAWIWPGSLHSLVAKLETIYKTIEPSTRRIAEPVAGTYVPQLLSQRSE